MTLSVLVNLAAEHGGVTAFFTENWISVLVALVIGVFGGGGIATILKAKPETTKILVDAAQGAVVVQSGVIDSLQENLTKQHEELEKAQAEILELRTHMAEINGLRSRVRELEHQNEFLQTENTNLRSELDSLKERFNQNGIN
jgi:peptidoglycan hydrolase CwlO-like protein